MPSKSGDPGGLAQIDASAPPESVPAAEVEAWLDLLPPHDLRIEHALTAAERAALADVLAGFLRALRHPDRASGLRDIEALLAGFQGEQGRPARVEDTGTPASAAQVDDFDAYFRVHRIASDAPAHALVRGLLQTARANMSLFHRAEHLPPHRVAQQIEGFAEYAGLLARAFDLGELS